ncbi:MAG: polyamine ABC transporter substrate-binding protein [Sciscionella sp.]
MSATNEFASSPDPAIWRGLACARMGRRDLLRLAGMGAGALGAGAILSACGVAAQGGQTKNVSQGAVARFWSGKKKTGHLDWANWPLYLDVSSHNKSDHPSLDEFTKRTGIKVNYSEAIQDDGPFFAKVQPSLSAKQYCGYDLAVITNGVYLDKFRELGYLIPLDHSKLPNFFQHAGKNYQNRSYDPHNTWSIPWQSGFTGLGYDPDKVGGEITDYADLLDPKFKGKIGMFADNEDLPNAGLLAIGVKPETSTEADWRKAADWLMKVKPNVRQYYNQDYIEALAKGDIWVSQAWSGDIFQQNLSGTNLKFVFPKSGSLLWTDNFVLLSHAKHPVDAMTLMNFYYQPKVAAMVSEYVNYVSPVPEAKGVVLADAAKASGADAKTLAEVAKSDAVFPSRQTYASAHAYRTLNNKELHAWNSIFEPVYQS